MVQRSSFDVPDAAVSRPQSASSTGREQQTGRDAILCSRLKGHQAATTCALVTSDVGEHVFRDFGKAAGPGVVLGGFLPVHSISLCCLKASKVLMFRTLHRSSAIGALHKKGCGSHICVCASKANHLSFVYHQGCRPLRQLLPLADIPISP